MANRRPSFQWYPGDWLKDPAVRSVSLAARGLWTDMICLMHESDRRGYLQHITGLPVTAEQLARMTGCSTDEVSICLRELKNSGVFSCTDNDVIYSRRMIRDERKRLLCAEAGKTGGNPKLKTHKGKPKGMSKGIDNPRPTPSSSSSTSVPSASADGPPVAAGCNGVSKTSVPEANPLRELTDYFTEKWKEKYQSRYPFRRLDGVKSAELLKLCGGSVDDAKATVDRYLREDGDFYRGHPIALLTSASQLPRFMSSGAEGRAKKSKQEMEIDAIERAFASSES